MCQYTLLPVSPLAALKTIAYSVFADKVYSVTLISYQAPEELSVKVSPLIVPEVKEAPVGL